MRTLRTQFNLRPSFRADVVTVCLSHDRKLVQNRHQARDEDNVVAPWSEHRTSVTRSGPNNNGRKR
jgi:hypothetical protein